MTPAQRRNDHACNENHNQQDGCTRYRIRTREQANSSAFGIAGHESDEVTGGIRESGSAHQTS
jgi:hypothetical protein